MINTVGLTCLDEVSWLRSVDSKTTLVGLAAIVNLFPIRCQYQYSFRINEILLTALSVDERLHNLWATSVNAQSNQGYRRRLCGRQ